MKNKIFTSSRIRAWDEYTIEHEPISSIDLMERAARAFCDFFEAHFSPDIFSKIKIICGPGNNGGDGLAIARMLSSTGFQTETWIPEPSVKLSEDTFENLQRLIGSSLSPLHYSNAMLPEFTSHDVVIDALFGTGINRPLTGTVADIITRLNGSGAKVISVDIASGLYSDAATPTLSPVVIPAATVTFQAPKLCHLLPQNERFSGYLHVADIGLSSEFEANEPSAHSLFGHSEAAAALPTVSSYAHKGTLGHVLLAAGSHGKAGASILAASACVRSGAGLVSVATAEVCILPLQVNIPEAMCIPGLGRQWLEFAPPHHTYTTLAAGPGLGQASSTAGVIEELLKKFTFKNCILDADALNLLARHPQWYSLFPEHTVLTPHIKEFERLAGQWNDEYERLELLRNLAQTRRCTVVLKGKNTAVASPDGLITFNTTGNPGMATGGSGDVLTGVVAALLATGLSAPEAARTSVFVHGLAGDLAAKEKGEKGMKAGDIVEKLPEAFKTLAPTSLF